MVEPSPSDVQSDELQYGSINDITQRILLWGKRPGMGLLRVEFSSEFARQEVLQRLQSELVQLKVPFKDIVLPTYQDPAVVADELEKALDECKSGVVSISGFATAFSPKVPLAEAMYYLNIRRELLAQRPLRQIWWMTPVFYQTALHAMPDLMSWFNLRLELTESVKAENLFQETSGSTVNIDDAKRRSLHLIQRFEQALPAGGDSEELLKLYLLPALEALAEVGAQKDLRDLTSRFEGYLSSLKMTHAPELATSLDRLSKLYFIQGRYLEAEPLLQKSLLLRKNLLGKDHPGVADSLDHLATLHATQGYHSEAEILYQDALAIYQNNLPECYPLVASSLNNLANLYQAQMRFDEAEPLYQEALHLFQQKFGKEHTFVSDSLNNLANLYAEQGRYIEAEPLYKEALDMDIRLLGENHPSVAQSLNNLASLYAPQERYTEAEFLYKRALDMDIKLLGENHPSVALVLDNLSKFYSCQERYTEAKVVGQKALNIRRQQLGENHPDTVNTLRRLELLRGKQKRSTQSEAFWIFR
jgi:tetratricopeptide (TPR) repeat protein